jgi:hypothetical protein
MISMIPEEDWLDAIQIIGWLYQYYNTEQNELVYDGTMLKVRLAKELVPAATTIYTPDWAVHYMVENSLGRYWLNGHSDDDLKAKWKYYLETECTEKIRTEYEGISPDEIKCLDPCMGSGHILVYMFDVLMQIYQSYGFSTRESVKSIIEKNLFGLDIDDRAAQLSYFAVMMKACQYDRRFLTRGVQPHIFSIKESNQINESVIDYFCNGNNKLVKIIKEIVDIFRDGKEYGSILQLPEINFKLIDERINEIEKESNLQKYFVKVELLPILNVAKLL